MKHAVTMLMAGLLFACSSPTDSRWEGQGMNFSEAATAAVQKVLEASPLHYVGNQIVRFKYDDAGAQREGQVTAYMDGSAVGWYIAPWQCPYAPAGSCDYGVDATIHDLTEEAVLADYSGMDCSTWPTYCELVGLRRANPGEDCGWLYGTWCPVYRCYSGCPATATDD